MKDKMYKIINIFLLVLTAILIVASIFIWIKFPYTYFEEIIFYYRMGLESADNSVFFEALKFGLPLVLIIVLIFYIMLYGINKFKIHPIKFMNSHKKIFTTLFLVIAVSLICSSLKVFDYFINNSFDSKFIEENYVDPKKTNIEFENKRNLVFIVVESLETSMFTKEQNGYWDYEVTPELYKLLNNKDAITFYNKNKAQGMNMIQGSSWTTASVIANTTGLPFKAMINKNVYNKDNFMNGSYALGDLLKDNGYYNEIISSANTSFGGLKEYFTKHGSYNIIDIESLEKNDLKMTKSDEGKWGFNDNYLFETAKKRLSLISKQEQPFNMELITIDTHFTDGFVGDYSLNKFDSQYENAYATESKLIYDFVNWIKSQDFYDNTTIVIVGDHISMQTDFFEKHGTKDRYVYNCIINPAVSGNNKNRVVTALDTYPTIVASLGGKIEGERLGLGVNLFSKNKTLAEKHGVKTLDKKLQKKSKFYNKLNESR